MLFAALLALLENKNTRTNQFNYICAFFSLLILFLFDFIINNFVDLALALLFPLESLKSGSEFVDSESKSNDDK